MDSTQFNLDMLKVIVAAVSNTPGIDRQAFAEQLRIAGQNTPGATAQFAVFAGILARTATTGKVTGTPPEG